MTTHVDVLVIGAGLSGVAAGYYLQTECPDLSYTILEGRESMGGTWDLFRYPGVRSDSDMYTLGYSFNPWPAEQTIAEGADILTYIKRTAAQYGIDEKIRYGHWVESADWDSDAAQWRVTAVHAGQRTVFTCGFLFTCTGYYDYDEGYTPEWPTLERYTGRVIHPQHWPEGLDVAGKTMTIIGSGATAITLAPALAQRGAQVTMVQRSPTYVVTWPRVDPLSAWLHRTLPLTLADRLTRWYHVVKGVFGYEISRAQPAAVKQRLIEGVRAELGEGFDVERHFTPHYDPWDQRVCVAADGDFFAALRAGTLHIVTDHIRHFTPQGIQLEGGDHLPSDAIITATGLVIKVIGGIDFCLDGQPVSFSQTLAYKGMMYSGIPNMASAFGYTNASWTLKCELIAQYVCRLLTHMHEHGYRVATPTPPTDVPTEPALDFTSGYVQRALHKLPSQGDRRPWKVYQNYLLDTLMYRFGRVDDEAMHFV